MPFFHIPPEKLPHLGLFGYDMIVDDGDHAWYSGPRGRTYVSKQAPFLWFEEAGEAVQLGAIGVVKTPDHD